MVISRWKFVLKVREVHVCVVSDHNPLSVSKVNSVEKDVFGGLEYVWVVFCGARGEDWDLHDLGAGWTGLGGNLKKGLYYVA